MSPRRVRELQTSLEKKGFRCDNTHHQMYWLYVGGRKTRIHTRLSHGENEYGVALLGQMARQCKLSGADFDDLIDCPLSAEEYVRRLVEQGHIIAPT